MNKKSLILRKNQHSLFTLVLAMLFFTSCHAQPNSNSSSGLAFQPLTQKTGQPKLVKTKGSTEGDNVWCGLEDKKGNLWFGTTGEGVYRYDGTSFIQFTMIDGLNSNSVYSMLEDRSGKIWIGTTDGICCYDGKKMSRVSMARNFLTSNDHYYNDQSTKNTVWSILQDKHGTLWFGTAEGVYCYDGKSFSPFLKKEGLINEQHLHLKMIDCMLEDQHGKIWFASGCPPGEEGVIVYDGKSITGFKPNGDGWVRYIKEDKKGNLWFGGRSHGNFVYDGKNFTNFTEKLGIGNPILVDNAGNIWFSGEEKLSTVESEGGIWCYDGKTFKNYNTKDGLGKYFVWSMLEDSKGNIWIGSRNTGLYKFDGKTFANFSE